ncbi:MAG: hypothetical protein CO034_00825 [Parcubacteria group bacterium CG_4_9_14_0_2_um_filter_35_11]|nr:MAG: hypothetical protein COS98_00315 [Parcubacteria group bacterium CG07_land_8_20_14_0_80_35_11]PJC47926.1 MAG: hypothetical protein CO034_00825 [Parcubacteria group bacterium CG_4_9_14_0_2_um_filter_35_11]
MVFLVFLVDLVKPLPKLPRLPILLIILTYPNSLIATPIIARTTPIIQNVAPLLKTPGITPKLRSNFGDHATRRNSSFPDPFPNFG